MTFSLSAAVALTLPLDLSAPLKPGNRGRPGRPRSMKPALFAVPLSRCLTLKTRAPAHPLAAPATDPPTSGDQPSLHPLAINLSNSRSIARLTGTLATRRRISARLRGRGLLCLRAVGLKSQNRGVGVRWGHRTSNNANVLCLVFVNPTKPPRTPGCQRRRFSKKIGLRPNSFDSTLGSRLDHSGSAFNRSRQ